MTLGVNSTFRRLSNQNRWELLSVVQPICTEHEALIGGLLDKAETAY